jgi:hypothetical protein
MTIEDKINQIAKEAVETSIIMGECYIKITYNSQTKECEMEILNPFTGCECGEHES